MPAALPAPPVALIWGEDDFAVKQRAKEIYQKWCAEVGGMDHEMVDAAVGNAGDAIKALGKLREALQTLPFFGGGKVVWFRDCNFLAEDRTSSSAAVTEHLAALTQELKTFAWQGVRLLVSAGKVDKRKTFYKTLEKIGTVEPFVGLSADDKDWADQAEMFARQQLRTLKKEISDEALGELVINVGPNLRLLHNETEKLALYVGERAEVEIGDVATITTKNKQARAFALSDAVGNRDLAGSLRRLDEELWSMKFDKDKSEIGLLYGLISKVRVLLFLREMRDAKLIQTTYSQYDYNKFKAALEKVPKELLPADRRFNPLAVNPFVLFKALPQVDKYTKTELVRAMDLLLECNLALISSSTDDAVSLQKALVKIIQKAA